MNISRWFLSAIIVILIGLFFQFDLQRFLTLDMLKAQQALVDSYRNSHPLSAALEYSLLYIAATALSVPGATILTLAGGAVFGLFWGTVIVSIASTIGATLAFWAARFLFRDAVESRFGDRLSAVNKGLDKDGAFYLFTLRLLPVFPFFVINLVMGLTTMKTKTFYWVSQIGMLAGTVVYVNAGTQLGKLTSVSDILSPALIGSFVLLGLFPLAAKRVVDTVNANKIYARWQRPAHFDFNVAVIGAGSGGLVSAYLAAAVKADVALIEKHRMGGDCLNTGCVPSKALIRSTRMLADMRRSRDFGIARADVRFDFADIMKRVREVVTSVEPHDSVERYTELGVEVIQGEAELISPWEIRINNDEQSRIVTARSIIIAAGAKPSVPPIPGIERIDYLTSDTVWQLTELPKRLVVLGGGPIGCELAQCFARLGSKVTQVEMESRLLNREDEEVSVAVTDKFRQEGIQVLTSHKAKRFVTENGEQCLVIEHDGNELTISFDRILLALGRTANVQGYGLEQVGVELTPRGTLAVNEFQQSNYPNIYACGDVAGPFQFTHVAAHQAWYAAINALFGELIKFRTDYSAIPWATFTEPEVARVGLNEQEAKANNIAYEVSYYSTEELDRAIADETRQGFVKLLTAPGRDKILGVTIVGAQAAELIAEFVLAIRNNIGLNKLLRTVHIYPTMSEANKYAAGVWRRNHASPVLMRCLTYYHAWRKRSGRTSNQ